MFVICYSMYLLTRNKDHSIFLLLIRDPEETYLFKVLFIYLFFGLLFCKFVWLPHIFATL